MRTCPPSWRGVTQRYWVLAVLHWRDCVGAAAAACLVQRCHEWHQQQTWHLFLRHSLLPVFQGRGCHGDAWTVGGCGLPRPLPLTFCIGPRPRGLLDLGLHSLLPLDPGQRHAWQLVQQHVYVSPTPAESRRSVLRPPLSRHPYTHTQHQQQTGCSVPRSSLPPARHCQVTHAPTHNTSSRQVLTVRPPLFHHHAHNIAKGRSPRLRRLGDRISFVLPSLLMETHALRC